MRLSSRYQTYAAVLLLLAITLIAYWRVLGNGFVKYDDDDYVYTNKHIQQGITAESLRWAFNVGYASNWHPLTWISHMVDWRLFGDKPMGHHLINLLLHILNAVLLLLVLRRMTGSLWKSAFVAALFAVHPLHVESVAWIAERKDVLSTFFWLLTMGAYVLYSEKPSIKRYLPVFFLYALGLMAKPMLVTLPLVLLLLDYWPLDRIRRGWSLVWEKLPFFALAAGSSALTLAAQKLSEAPIEKLTLGMRVSNALVSYASYLAKTLWPAKLAVFYPHPSDMLPAWKVALSVLLLVGFSVLAFKAAAKRPYIGFGWLWYLVTLLPVIGVIQVGWQAMADRYTYVPLIGLFVAGAWLAPDFTLGTKRWGDGATGRRGEKIRIPMIAAACTIIALLAMGTRVQVGYWHDSFALFQHAIDVTEGNFLAHLNVGYMLSKQGKVDEAIMHYNEAIAARPDWDQAHYNLGTMLAKRGDTEEAIEQYKEAIRLNPKSSAARANLVCELLNLGRVEEALEFKGEDGGTAPGTAELHFNMGCALEQQGKVGEALREYQEAVRLKPDFGMAHNNLAVDYYYIGSYAEAWKEVHLAQKYQTTVNPGFLQALTQKMPDPGG